MARKDSENQKKSMGAMFRERAMIQGKSPDAATFETKCVAVE